MKEDECADYVMVCGSCGKEILPEKETEDYIIYRGCECLKEEDK